MLKWIKDMFSEDPKATVSAMRVMAFGALIFACHLAAYSVYAGKDAVSLVALFLGCAFGGKVAQKYME